MPSTYAVTPEQGDWACATVNVSRQRVTTSMGPHQHMLSRDYPERVPCNRISHHNVRGAVDIPTGGVPVVGRKEVSSPSSADATEFVPGRAAHPLRCDLHHREQVWDRDLGHESRGARRQDHASTSRCSSSTSHVLSSSSRSSCVSTTAASSRSGFHSEAFKNLRVLQGNACTLHPRELLKSCTKQACNDVFAKANAHIICVQEGRIQRDGPHSCAHYRMYRAGATDRGMDGSQVWIRHELSHLVTAVKVISARLLRVVLQDCAVRIHILSGHAPIEAATSEEKEHFWSDLLLDIEKLRHDDSNIIMCGIDGNARLGSITNEFVGDAEKESESDSGAALRLLATEAHLQVINTFHSAGPTWCSAKGVKSSYRLLPRTA